MGKATDDADFRARLLSDPKGALEQELSVTIPASLSVEVHEESGTTAHLVLPPDSRLSESDLQAVAGGARPRGQEWTPAPGNPAGPLSGPAGAHHGVEPVFLG